MLIRAQNARRTRGTPPRVRARASLRGLNLSTSSRIPPEPHYRPARSYQTETDRTEMFTLVMGSVEKKHNRTAGSAL